MNKLKKNMKKVKCRHEETKILKSYRTNFTHGKNSRPTKFDPPRRCTMICEKCGERLMRWKPKK